MRDYKLKHFFMLVALLVLGLVAFVIYGHRTNAPSNIYENDVDVSAPFYETQESAPLGTHEEQMEETHTTEEHGSNMGSEPTEGHDSLSGHGTETQSH